MRAKLIGDKIWSQGVLHGTWRSGLLKNHYNNIQAKVKPFIVMALAFSRKIFMDNSMGPVNDKI